MAFTTKSTVSAWDAPPRARQITRSCLSCATIVSIRPAFTRSLPLRRKDSRCLPNGRRNTMPVRAPVRLHMPHEARLLGKGSRRQSDGARWRMKVTASRQSPPLLSTSRASARAVASSRRVESVHARNAA